MRTNSAERKSQLLIVGAKLASKHGAVNVTRRMVAKAAGVSEALVAHYMGSAKDAQVVYARQAKKLGLVQPSKEKIEAIGTKLRAHRTPTAPRKRSAKEVKAIMEKRVSKTKGKAVSKAKAKKVAVRKTKGIGRAPENKARKVTAARKPKSAPPLAAAPPVIDSGDVGALN